MNSSGRGCIKCGFVAAQSVDYCFPNGAGPLCVRCAYPERQKGGGRLVLVDGCWAREGDDVATSDSRGGDRDCVEAALERLSAAVEELRNALGRRK